MDELNSPELLKAVKREVKEIQDEAEHAEYERNMDFVREFKMGLI